MIDMRSYSIEDLEELTGFNQRTIAYYIQQGLLPKIGRRGRSTRYPQLYADRLGFIKRVRQLQDEGRLGSITLPRIARVIWYLVEKPGGDQLALADLSDTEIQKLFFDDTVPEAREIGTTDDGTPVTANFGKYGPYVKAGAQTASIDAGEFNSISLAEALERIAAKVAGGERRLIRDFPDEEIQVLGGRFGPYVRQGDINANVPGELDPSQLTLADCRALLDNRRDRISRKGASSRREISSARVRDVMGVSSRVRSPMARSSMSMTRRRDGDPVPRESVNVPEFLRRRDVDDDSVRTARDLVEEIDGLAARARRSDRQTETWTRAQITQNIELAVHGIDSQHVDLVESLARRLRELLGVD